MRCKICNNDTKTIFAKKILNKYDVNYHQCLNCDFIQTDEVFWLDEAYKSVINNVDIGLISRNIVYSEEVTAFFRMAKFDRNKKYLDYGGGYGIFVRMMRDNGFNFYWSDEYCENLYVKKFASNDLENKKEKFETLTAFEVFEHLVDPMKEIEKMLQLSDNLLFSTELSNGHISDATNWWYIGATHGQHIAFYNLKTLEFIAKKYNLNLCSNKNLHFLGKKKISKTTFKIATNYKIARLYNTVSTPQSLLASDFEIYLKDEEN